MEYPSAERHHISHENRYIDSVKTHSLPSGFILPSSSLLGIHSSESLIVVGILGSRLLAITIIPSSMNRS